METRLKSVEYVILIPGVYCVSGRREMNCWPIYSIPGSSKRPLRAKYPTLEAEVNDFIRYVRSQRLPETRSHVKAFAMSADEERGINNFQASNGWLQCFLKRNCVQSSFKLHGKGGTRLPASIRSRIAEIRETLFTYKILNVYNMDESGLFYRLGPPRTYLTAEECRRETRGAPLHKHKNRLTIVMCVNDDVSHSVAVKFIGQSKQATALKQSRLSYPNDQYMSQAKVWMDSSRFEVWIQQRYDEIRKKSVGPWCLLMDNCGGHELSIPLSGVEILYLAPRSTGKHQPLDLGLIATAKIRYRSALLSGTLDVLKGRRRCNQGIHSNTGHGKWGLFEGQLPHFVDAMELFNQSWSSLSRITGIKCFIKSLCLNESHVMHLNSILQSLERDSDIGIDLTAQIGNTTSDNTQVISHKQLRNIRSRLAEYKYLGEGPQTPLNEILEEVTNIEAESDLLAVLLSHAPFDCEPNRLQLSEKNLAGDVRPIGKDVSGNQSS